jgi:hypothetical protein
MILHWFAITCLQISVLFLRNLVAGIVPRFFFMQKPPTSH